MYYEKKVLKLLDFCTLKNVRNICEVEKPSRARARKVVNPPLKTAGPISSTAFSDRSCLVPVSDTTDQFTGL
jgi:hypothetical protein